MSTDQINTTDERAELLALVDGLLDTYRPVGVAIWLNSQNKNLGASPAELMEQGRWSELHQEAERLAGGPREHVLSADCWCQPTVDRAR